MAVRKHGDPETCAGCGGNISTAPISALSPLASGHWIHDREVCFRALNDRVKQLAARRETAGGAEADNACNGRGRRSDTLTQ